MIELSVCRAHGRSLIGPPAEELIGPVEDEWVDALYKIAENVCRTRRRSRFRRGRYETAGDLLGLLEPAAAEPVRDERMDALPEILAGMPASQRRALLLREVQGLSYREIAEQLQTSVSAVETLLFRARRSFVRELERFARPAERAFSLGTLAVSLKSLVSRSLVASSGANTAAAVVGAAAVAGGVIAAAPTVVAGSSTSPPVLAHERSVNAARVPPERAATSGTNARGPHHAMSRVFRAKARADLSTDASRPAGAAGNALPPAGGDPVAPTSSPRPAAQPPTATTPRPPAPDRPEPPVSVTAPSLPPLPVATPPPTVPALPLPQLPPVPQLPPPPSVPLPSLP